MLVVVIIRHISIFLDVDMYQRVSSNIFNNVFTVSMQLIIKEVVLYCIKRKMYFLIETGTDFISMSVSLFNVKTIVPL